MARFVLALGILLLPGCAQKDSGTTSTETVTLTADDIVSRLPLDEGDAPLGAVRDVAIAPAGLVLAASNPPSVTSFDWDGRRQQSFGAEGAGPGEYKMPVALSVSDSLLYVWDAASIKLLSYRLPNGSSSSSSSSSGGGEYEREIRFTVGILDVDVEGDRILFYREGSDYTFASATDLSGEELWSFGRIDFADMMLGMLVGAGRVTLTDNFGWFAKPSNPRLYRVDLDTWRVDSVDVVDDAFKVEQPVHVVERQDVVTKWPQSVAYMSTNSRVVGVHQAGDLLAVEVEHGALPYADSPANTRWSRVHFYTRDMAPVGTVEIPTELRQDLGGELGGAIIATNSMSLYFLRPPVDDDGNWLLSSIAIPDFAND